MALAVETEAVAVETEALAVETEAVAVETEAVAVETEAVETEGLRSHQVVAESVHHHLALELIVRAVLIPAPRARPVRADVQVTDHLHIAMHCSVMTLQCDVLQCIVHYSVMR